MSRGGVPIVFAVVLLWAVWSSSNSPAPVVAPPKPAPVATTEPQPESLFVSSVNPAVVIVADLSSKYASQWMQGDAAKLKNNGWTVRSLDLEGLDEVRFYVRADGSWRVHNGHMSLNSLRMMLGNQQ